MNDDAIASLLVSGAPGLVALMGEPVFRLQAAVSKAHEDTNLETVQIQTFEELFHAAQANSNQPADRTLCLSLPASELPNAQTLLGEACRAAPRLVIVEHAECQSGDGLLADEQFFAFGFRKLGNSVEPSGVKRCWYAFSLRDYKQAPDWLNARFWAHPERFSLSENS